MCLHGCGSRAGGSEGQVRAVGDAEVPEVVAGPQAPQPCLCCSPWENALKHNPVRVDSLSSVTPAFKITTCADYKNKMFVTFDRNKLKLKSLVACIVQLVFLSLADSLENTV